MPSGQENQYLPYGSHPRVKKSDKEKQDLALEQMKRNGLLPASWTWSEVESDVLADFNIHLPNKPESALVKVPPSLHTDLD